QTNRPAPEFEIRKQRPCPELSRRAAVRGSEPTDVAAYAESVDVCEHSAAEVTAKPVIVVLDRDPVANVVGHREQVGMDGHGPEAARDIRLITPVAAKWIRANDVAHVAVHMRLRSEEDTIKAHIRSTIEDELAAYDAVPQISGLCTVGEACWDV